MKKTILTLLFFAMFVSLSHAAWTVTASLDRTLLWNSGQTMHIFKFVCASDASSSGDIVFTTQLKENTLYGPSVLIRTNEVDELWKSVVGGVVYFVKYEPSATAVPASTTTITIDDETGWLFFSKAVTTANTAQGWSGDVDTGANVPMTELTLAMTTLGNADEAIIWIWVLR